MQKKLEKRIFEEKSQKMTKKVPNLNKVVFAKEVILGPEICKKCQKNTSKKQTKNDTPKNDFLRRSGAIFDPKEAEIRGFWVDFGCQVLLFLALKFWMVL